MFKFTAALAISAALLAGCSSTDEKSDKKDADASAAVEGYTPVSNVDAHAAVGQDAAKARELMEPAKEGGKVDWAAVAAAVREGGASAKDDGSFRTIAGLAEDHPVLATVNAALDGKDAGASDAVRRQQVDKGITVLIAAKVLGELDSAAEKIEAGETDPAEGAPHNVDEAFAFFVAEGEGPISTAMKRGEDFSLDLKTPVIDALVAAQKAAVDGDAKAFATAAAEVRAAVNHIFYLATHKYLDHEDDEETKAEGTTFYFGIQPQLAGSAEDKAIAAAFASGDADAGRAALNRAAKTLDVTPLS